MQVVRKNTTTPFQHKGISGHLRPLTARTVCVHHHPDECRQLQKESLSHSEDKSK